MNILDSKKLNNKLGDLALLIIHHNRQDPNRVISFYIKGETNYLFFTVKDRVTGEEVIKKGIDLDKKPGYILEKLNALCSLLVTDQRE